MAKTKLTADDLRSFLEYDPETGVFKWKVSLSKRRGAGNEAGTIKNGHRYKRIGIKNTIYQAHRLAWLYVHGEWPKGHIDHINNNPLDNRICNLREATQSQNLRNRGMQKNNTSGFKGVSWHKQARKWVAHIKFSEKMKYLGSFATAEEAHDTYVKAAETHHKEFARC